MAFNTLEYLEKGRVEFIDRITSYDYKTLIINVRKNKDRVKIINGFLPKLIDTHPTFCFSIIYDIPEFQKESESLFYKIYKEKEVDLELLVNIITKSDYGHKYLEDNFEHIINTHQKNFDNILTYLFKEFDKSSALLKRLSLHKNLYIRFQFMHQLLNNYPEATSIFYDDITKYLTSYTNQEYEQLQLFPELMEMEYVCKLAYIALSNNDYDLWQKFKSFILSNYKYNTLASEILIPKNSYYNEKVYKAIDEKTAIKEFNKDADTLFTTSIDYRLTILRNYSQNISRELLEQYKKEIQLFYSKEKIDYLYRKMENHKLARKITEYIEKYLSLSKNKECSQLEKGSTASTYRVGDYVLKLINTKWSYEEIICPNIYLILNNLEEDFIRDEQGIVLAGLEVQKYLEKDAKEVPKYIFSEYLTELNRLGYYSTDTLIGGTCGDNCRLLNHYKESGNINPPEWFKEYPLVLVDRDRIYKLTNRYPKQLREGY